MLNVIDCYAVSVLNVVYDVVMLSVIMLSVIMPSVVMLSVIILSVVMMSVIILSGVMLSFVMLRVIMLSVVAADWHFHPSLTRRFYFQLENIKLGGKLMLPQKRFIE